MTMQDDNSRQTVLYTLSSGTVEVSSEVLAAIQEALISFMESPDPKFMATYADIREFFLMEIRAAGYWIEEGRSAQIGAWRLEPTDDHLVLVRYPPIGEEMVFFQAHLEQMNARWMVVDFQHKTYFDVEEETP